MISQQTVSADYQAAPNLLADRVILVTGATGGIGHAVSRRLAAAGATVVLLGREIKRLEAVYDELTEIGPEPAIYPMNLEGASFDHYPEVAQTIGEQLGRLDGILHTAAALGRPAPMELYDVESWYRTLQINLNAPFMLTRACLPLLRKSPDASLLFTSDAVGRNGGPYWGAYGVSKAGLEGMMRILSAELADTTPVRVNSIDPGPVSTQFRRDAFPAEEAGLHPLPEQVAGAFLWLLGPESTGVHGQALTVAPSQK